MNDTAHAADRKPTRRGRRPNPPRPCPREGCQGSIRPSGHEHCSFICGAIAQELERAQRVCEAIGPGTPLASELWAEAVALSDGWSRHIELDRRLYREALSVGFTREQWQAIKDGKPVTHEEAPAT